MTARRRRKAQPPGRPLRWMVTQGPSGPGQNPAYRPPHRHQKPVTCENTRMNRPGSGGGSVVWFSSPGWGGLVVSVER